MESSKKTDKAFELIQSMSMSEKRYFKLFAGRHSSNEKSNYLKLFEALEQQRESYNPDEVIKILEEQSVSTRYLSSDKSYLYNLILRSLSAYHWSKASGLQVKELLHQVEILYERGMSDHCMKLLRKARNLAENHKLYNLLPEIERYEYRVASVHGDFKFISELLPNLEKTSNIITNLRSYSSLHNEMNLHKRTYAKARTAAIEKEVSQVMRHPFLQEGTQPPSFWAELYYWEIHAAYQYILDCREKELEANLKALELIEAQPTYEQDFPAEYAHVRARILILQSHLDDAAFEEKLIAFQQLPDRPYQPHHQVNANIYVNAHLAQMWRLVEKKRFEDACNFILVMESIYDTFKADIPTHVRISYQYLFAYVYLANGIFDRSLKHANIIINEFSDKERPDLHAFARLLSLILHFELDHSRLLPYQLDATRPYPKRRSRQSCMQD